MDELINSFLIESDKAGNVRIQSYGISELDVLKLLIKRERMRQREAKMPVGEGKVIPINANVKRYRKR